jgi:hypothetical protein
MYLDTVTYNRPAVKMVLEWMGADRVVYGSDAPPLTSLKSRAIALIKELDIPEPQRQSIFWRNAARLLKLPIAGVGNADASNQFSDGLRTTSNGTMTYDGTSH